jgi:hypothetical protein
LAPTDPKAASSKSDAVRAGRIRSIHSIAPRDACPALFFIEPPSIVQQIETRPGTAAVGLGLELLKLSSQGVQDLSQSIDKISTLAARDGKEHDFTVTNSKLANGITVHCNTLPDPLAAPKLKRHCELRKYSVKANQWFGLAIQPKTAAVRFGLTLDYPWQQNKAMDDVVARMPKAQPIEVLRSFAKSKSVRRRVGRNEPCPCGSGLKYKRCHLRQDEGGRGSPT